MNIKIAELYQKAHREVEHTYYSSVVDPTITSTTVTRHFDHTLFAELIVRECADAIAKDNRLNDVRSAANGCVRVIKQHFGVE